MSRGTARRVATRPFTGERASFLADVIWGLSLPHRAIPCKWLYDRRGSLLFERICELEAYYPTRIETSITEACAPELAELVGPGARLVELGSGSSVKTRLLLDRLPELASYVPIDISREHLAATVRRLAHEYPRLTISPLVADFLRPLTLPAHTRRAASTVVYFPGSTLGNLEPSEASRLLRSLVDHCTPRGGLLVGIDREKDPAVVARAYDDPEGVTAAFNRNVLVRLRAELGAAVDPYAFAHHAPYDAAAGFVEMRLVSKAAQAIRVGTRTFALEEGDFVRTERSYKYSALRFEKMATDAGLRVSRAFTDERAWFALNWLVRA